MTKRIAVGGFLHETNTFAPSKATLDDFIRGSGSGAMVRGDEIFTRSGKSNQSIMGAIAHAQEQGWDIAPTLWCATSPSAHVTKQAFETIAAELIERTVAALPLDGIYLDLHGAMVCEHLDDGEGALLSRLRAAVGDVPIVVSLDLHANVTPLMVANADVLDSYRTYPHVDMAETGRRCAGILGRLMDGAPNEKAFLQAPFLTAISWQCTDEQPAKALYAEVARLAANQLSVSFNMGFPAADFPDCGMSVTAYGPGAALAAKTLMDRVTAAEPDFAGEVLTPTEAVARAAHIQGTVVIADTQDNPGAGGDANTTGMLHALIAADARNALIGGIFDPAAALAAHAAGQGATARITLGGQSGGDAPVTADFVVEAISNGKFTTKGPFYGHGAMDLGPCAALRIGGVRVCVISGKSQMADREMFRHLALTPEDASIIVVKSSVHFRADFAPIASAILVAAAPGPMAVDPALLPWTRLRPGLRTSPLGAAFQEPEHADA